MLTYSLMLSNRSGTDSEFRFRHRLLCVNTAQGFYTVLLLGVLLLESGELLVALLDDVSLTTF